MWAIGTRTVSLPSWATAWHKNPAHTRLWRIRRWPRSQSLTAIGAARGGCERRLSTGVWTPRTGTRLIEDAVGLRVNKDVLGVVWAPSRLLWDTPAPRAAIRWARMAMRERGGSRNHDIYTVEGEVGRQRTPLDSHWLQEGKNDFLLAMRGGGGTLRTRQQNIRRATSAGFCQRDTLALPSSVPVRPHDTKRQSSRATGMTLARGTRHPLYGPLRVRSRVCVLNSHRPGRRALLCGAGGGYPLSRVANQWSQPAGREAKQDVDWPRADAQTVTPGRPTYSGPVFGGGVLEGTQQGCPVRGRSVVNLAAILYSMFLLALHFLCHSWQPNQELLCVHPMADGSSFPFSCATRNVHGDSPHSARGCVKRLGLFGGPCWVHDEVPGLPDLTHLEKTQPMSGEDADKAALY